MRRLSLAFLGVALSAVQATAQSTARPERSEEKQKEQHAVAKVQEKKAQHTTVVNLQGEKSLADKEFRSQLK
jgi:hypothetical protein